MADSVDTVSKIVTYHIADAVGATIAALALREDNQVRVVGLRGLPAEEAVRWEVFPLDAAAPRATSSAVGQRLVMAGAAAIAEATPISRHGPRRTHARRPAVAGAGRTFGSIALSFPERRARTRRSSSSSRSWPTRAPRRSSASRPRPWPPADRTADLPRRGLHRARQQPRPRGDDRQRRPPGRADLRRLVRHRRRPGRPDAPPGRGPRRPGEGPARHALQERWPPDPSSPERCVGRGPQREGPS